MPTAVQTPLVNLTQNALTLIHKRYLWHSPYIQGVKEYDCRECYERTGTIEYHETLDEFFDRISMGKQEYRDEITSLRFLPNSPTMFNIGTGMGTLIPTMPTLMREAN